MLTDLLANFTDAVALGIGNIRPFINRLLFLLLVIDFTLWGYKIALGSSDADIGPIAWKLLTTGLLYYIIINFASLSWLFENSVLNISTKISGRTNVDLFMRPDEILGFANRELLKPMNDLMKELGKFKLGNLGIYIAYGLLWVIVMLCFGVIAINIVLAIVEFHLLVLFSLILVPFLIFEPTRFIGNKPFGAVVGAAVKIGMLVVVAGIVINLFTKALSFPSPEDINLKWVMAIIVMSTISAYIVIQVPGLAASLLSGVPSLSAGGAFRTLSGLAAGVASSMIRSKRTAGKAGKFVAGVGKAVWNVGKWAGKGTAKMIRNAQSQGANAAGSKTGSESGASNGSSAVKDFQPARPIMKSSGF